MLFISPERACVASAVRSRFLEDRGPDRGDTVRYCGAGPCWFRGLAEKRRGIGCVSGLCGGGADGVGLAHAPARTLRKATLT